MDLIAFHLDYYYVILIELPLKQSRKLIQNMEVKILTATFLRGNYEHIIYGLFSHSWFIYSQGEGINYQSIHSLGSQNLKNPLFPCVSWYDIDHTKTFYC